MAHESDSHGDDHGHGGLGKYLMVGAGLGVLTTISFVVGSSQTLMHDAPHVGWTVMIAVSCMKALLVMLFFMHLIWEANWKYVLTIPASIMSLFLMLMLVPDIGLRARWYSEERQLHAATPVVGPANSPLEHAHTAKHAEGETDGGGQESGHGDD
jgi:cytochrome c oxidase subunit 4